MDLINEYTGMNFSRSSSVVCSDIALTESTAPSSSYSSLHITSIDSATFLDPVIQVKPIDNMEPPQHKTSIKEAHKLTNIDESIISRELTSTTLFQAVRDWSQLDFMNVIHHNCKTGKLGSFSRLLQTPDESGMYVLHYASKLNRFFVLDQLLRRKDVLQVFLFPFLLVLFDGRLALCENTGLATGGY